MGSWKIGGVELRLQSAASPFNLAHGLIVATLPRSCALEWMEGSRATPTAHASAHSIADHGEVLFAGRSNLIEATAQPSVLAPGVDRQAHAEVSVFVVLSHGALRDSLHRTEHHRRHTWQGASDDVGRAPHVSTQVRPQSVWDQDSIWIRFYSPIRAPEAAYDFHSLPNINEQARVPCGAVDGGPNSSILEVLAPNWTCRSIPKVDPTVAGKDIKLFTSKDARAAICIQLSLDGVALCGVDLHNREAIERWMSPGPRGPRSQSVARPRLIVIKLVNAGGAAPRAHRPADGFLETLGSWVAATHLRTATLAIRGALGGNPISNVNLGAGFGQARRSAALRSAIPNVCVRVCKQGTMQARRHTHSPARLLQIALIACILAAHAFTAIFP